MGEGKEYIQLEAGSRVLKKAKEVLQNSHLLEICLPHLGFLTVKVKPQSWMNWLYGLFHTNMESYYMYQ